MDVFVIIDYHQTLDLSLISAELSHLRVGSKQYTASEGKYHKWNSGE